VRSLWSSFVRVQLFYTKRSSFELYIQTYPELAGAPGGCTGGEGWLGQEKR